MRDASEVIAPCPFCGGDANVHRDDGASVVGCDSCCYALETGTVGIGWFTSDAEAIAAWNRRTPQPASADVVDAVRFEYRFVNRRNRKDGGGWSVCSQQEYESRVLGGLPDRVTPIEWRALGVIDPSTQEAAK